MGIRVGIISSYSSSSSNNSRFRYVIVRLEGVNCFSVCLEGGMESMYLLINVDFILYFIVFCLGRYE